MNCTWLYYGIIIADSNMMRTKFCQITSPFVHNPLCKAWLAPYFLLVRVSKVRVCVWIRSFCSEAWMIFKKLPPPASISLRRMRHNRWEEEVWYCTLCTTWKHVCCAVSSPWVCIVLVKPKPRGASMETDASPVHCSTYIAIDKAQGRQNAWLKGDNGRCRPITTPAIFGYKAEPLSKSVTSQWLWLTRKVMTGTSLYNGVLKH